MIKIVIIETAKSLDDFQKNFEVMKLQVFYLNNIKRKSQQLIEFSNKTFQLFKLKKKMFCMKTRYMVLFIGDLMIFLFEA